jgi:hypothetical protein
VIIRRYYLYLFLCLFSYNLFVYLLIIYLFIDLLFICLFTYLFVYLVIIYLFIYLFIYIYLFTINYYLFIYVFIYLFVFTNATEKYFLQQDVQKIIDVGPSYDFFGKKLIFLLNVFVKRLQQHDFARMTHFHGYR